MECYILKQKLQLSEKEIKILELLGIKFLKENQILFSEDQCNCRVLDLPLSARSFNCLRNTLIYWEQLNITLEEFCNKYTKNDLFKMRNFGKKSMAELLHLLAERGYSLY